MILNFEKEVQEIVDALGGGGGYNDKAMKISMVLACVLDRGIGEERRRCIQIIQRMAINPQPIVAEIRKPIR